MLFNYSKLNFALVFDRICIIQLSFLIFHRYFCSLKYFIPSESSMVHFDIFLHLKPELFHLETSNLIEITRRTLEIFVDKWLWPRPVDVCAPKIVYTHTLLLFQLRPLRGGETCFPLSLSGNCICKAVRGAVATVCISKIRMQSI